MALRAFHGDPAIKAFFLARVREHRDADALIHGTYWEHGKGCAVGCTVHSGHHAAYEQELGIPRILAHLEDGIFENLAPPDDVLWPERFLAAIPVGADLAMVWPQFALQLLGDEGHGVVRFVQAQRHARQKAGIENVVALYQHWVLSGEKPTTTTAAYAAANAAYAAEASYVAYAAYAAAYAAYAVEASYAGEAAYAANAAAFAASVSNAANAAEAAEAVEAARLWQAQTLIALLTAASVDVKNLVSV
jgi:hypothetical protein